MYHPGKVMKVFSPRNADVRSSDNTTQALLEMWDQNVLTLLVDPHIAHEVKESDIVLVDYTAVSQSNPNPKHVVVKILRGKDAGATWEKYRKYNEKRKAGAKAAPARGAAPEYFG
ncbi:MAG: hypothetical protein HY368_00250 [Candidatus Aenigmarchaeota archaeon]|nr:hypothetical protein [Candidatus Aenigmarchaeota archaeon]